MLLFRCNFPERQLKKNTDEKKKIYKPSEVLAETKFSIIQTSNELYSNNCLTIRLTVKHS